MSRFAVAPHGSKGYFHLRPTYHFPQHYIDMWNAKYGGMTIDGPNTDSCSTSWCAERYGVECVSTVSSPSNGYGCDGAWETFPTQQMNRAGTSSKRVDLIPCGGGLFLSAWGGPIPFVVGGGGGCMFDILWQIHLHDGECKAGSGSYNYQDCLGMARTEARAYVSRMSLERQAAHQQAALRH